MSKLLACLCVLLLCGNANIAVGQLAVGQRAVVEAQRLPVLGKIFSVRNKLIRGVLVVGASLALLCSQTGCGTDGGDEVETGSSELVAPVEDTSIEEVLEIAPTPYTLFDYVGKYIIYVGEGDVSFTTGYVSQLRGGKLIIKANLDEKAKRRRKDEKLLNENLREITLDIVVGVMHRTHELIGKEVFFPRIHGAMPTDRWADNMRFDNFYGTVDVVYIEALLPEGSGETTAVGVTVHAGDIGGVRAALRGDMPYTVFLPIGRVQFTEADEGEVDDIDEVKPIRVDNN